MSRLAVPQACAAPQTPNANKNKNKRDPPAHHVGGDVGGPGGQQQPKQADRQGGQDDRPFSLDPVGDEEAKQRPDRIGDGDDERSLK